MYDRTGVIRPDLDAEAYNSLADHYSTLASQATASAALTRSSVAAVMAENDGPAAKAFRQKVTGGGSIVQHFELLGPAATRTSNAYRATAISGANAQSAMDTVAFKYDQAYVLGILRGAQPADLALLVNIARNELQSLENLAVSEIKAAFADLDLPQKFNTGDTGGSLDPGIEERWAELTDDERKEILQNIADAYADEHGIPRMKIDFEPIESDPGYVTYGDYYDGKILGLGSRLRINSDQLHNPHLINTVIHEMQHRAQYQGMRGRLPWQDERAGMSREEAERWRELNSEEVRTKGGDTKQEQYVPRPIEVDARRAGRDYIDNLTLEEFEEFVP